MLRLVGICHTVVPAGSYQKTSGVAAPCPRGEYKEASGSDTNCTACSAVGVTTAREGSTSAADCSHLQPGFYAAAMSPVNGAITAADVCPVGYFCRGGKPTRGFAGLGNTTSSSGSNSNSPGLTSVADPTLTPCPSGTVTQAPGASSPDQCLTPPGHYTDAAAGQTLQCPSGSYRSDWKPPGQASSCVPCGEGVSGEATGQLLMYPPGASTPVQETVSDSPESCCEYFSKWAAPCQVFHGGWIEPQQQWRQQLLVLLRLKAANAVAAAAAAAPSLYSARGRVSPTLEPAALLVSLPLSCSRACAHAVQSSCQAGGSTFPASPTPGEPKSVTTLSLERQTSRLA